MLVLALEGDGAGAGVFDEFIGADGVEASGAVFGLVAAVAQADDEQAGGVEQIGEDAEGALADRLRDVHPDRAQEDQVEAAAEGAQLLELGQGVIEPGDFGVGAPLAGFAQLARLDGEHFPALFGEPVGVAAGSRADVAGEAGLSAFQMLLRPSAVDDRRGVGLVLLEERVPVLIVIGGAVQDGGSCG